MNEPLISVIIPVYNVEKYLDRCISSIVNQTYKNLEIILVDDGSPDNCLKICDEWKNKDERIIVVHKENGGLSDARNTGLEIASGEYISFIDSDDWVSKEFIRCLYLAIKNSNSEICECEVIRTDVWNNSDDCFKDDFTISSFTTEQAMELLIKNTVFHQHVWNKLYKKECLQNILFVKGKINEDEFWTYRIFGNARQISKIQCNLYFYFQRPESIMGVNYNIRRLDVLEAKLERQNYIDQRFPALSNLALVNLIQTCIYSGQMTLLYITEYNERKYALMRIVFYFNISIKRLKKYSLSFKYRVWINLAKMSFVMTCKIRNILKIGF